MRLKSKNEYIGEWLLKYDIELRIVPGRRLRGEIHSPSYTGLVAFEGYLENVLDEVYHWIKNESPYASFIEANSLEAKRKINDLKPDCLCDMCKGISQ